MGPSMVEHPSFGGLCSLRLARRPGGRGLGNFRLGRRSGSGFLKGPSGVSCFIGSWHGGGGGCGRCCCCCGCCCRCFDTRRFKAR